MRIGIYGGAFNPPHLGHIQAAAFAAQSLQLNKLLLIPTCVSPHKQVPSKSADGADRLKMLEIAAKIHPRLCPSAIELDRGGQSYTFQTVQQVKGENPDAEVILFMGTDMFLSFLNWRNPGLILQNASIGVFYRGEKQEAERIAQQKLQIEALGAKVYLVENPVTEISSTQLRRMLIFGCGGKGPLRHQGELQEFTGSTAGAGSLLPAGSQASAPCAGLPGYSSCACKALGRQSDRCCKSSAAA